MERKMNTMEKSCVPYKEPFRNQFHYSMRRGWLSDVNGVWYKDGYYHITHQSDEDEMYCLSAEWGHARSADLLHWEQLPCALRKGENTVGQAYSGTAVVDITDAAGFGENTVLLFYTDNELGQCMNILDETTGVFVPYENNPVVELDDIGKEQGIEPGAQRDPKIFHDPVSGKWFMMVYREREPEHGQVMQMYRSQNLKEWTRIEDFLQDDYRECPAIFQLSVRNEPEKSFWVIMAASGRYCLAQFEGEKFTVVYDEHRRLIQGFDAYAGQTFVNVPQNRTIYMCWLDDWMGSSVETTPWRNSFSVPMELSLVKCGEGCYRLFANPVEELKQLRTQRVLLLKETTIAVLSEAITGVQEKALDLTLLFDFTNTAAETLFFNFRGKKITYRISTGEWSTTCTTVTIKERASTREFTGKIQPVNGKLKMRFLIDSDSLEVFFNDGESLYFEEYGFDPEQVLAISADADVPIDLAEAYAIKSIW